MQNAPLVFVYLGNRFPKYGFASLSLALQTTPNPLIVLGDSARPKRLPKPVQWVDTRQFYDSSEFHYFRSESNLPADFRNGFWLHTAERFFVLRQFMQKERLNELFHGELDCLFFSLDQLQAAIEQTAEHGFFFPRETADRGIASLVFINSQRSLDACCSFLTQEAALGNEMDILGSLPHGRESDFFALPTAGTLYRKLSAHEPQDWETTPTDSDLIVDGAAIGRWVFGLDPRNTRDRGTRNRIQNHKNAATFDYPLSQLSFRAHKRPKWSVEVSVDGGRWHRVLVLHVHSKVHHKITWRYLLRTLALLNSGRSRRIVPISPRFFARISSRIFRQMWATLRNPQKISSAMADIRRPNWWKTLGRRVWK